MHKDQLELLLSKVQDGRLPIAKALEELRHLPGQELDAACLDHHRSLRTGIPEVIYGASKTAQQIADIARALAAQGNPVLATRVDADKAHQVLALSPNLTYEPNSRVLYANQRPVKTDEYHGFTLIVCAGTSDLGVAEEARLTLQTFGHPTQYLYDVGVAGLHRLLSRQKLLHQAQVIIVVAGMEGALPSVVAGLVQAPVIAVPTSVGYGAHFGGVAALLGMLNSCAPGISVVNIDNGFGAACMAEAINRKRDPSPEA